MEDLLHAQQVLCSQVTLCNSSLGGSIAHTPFSLFPKGPKIHQESQSPAEAAAPKGHPHPLSTDVQAAA